VRKILAIASLAAALVLAPRVDAVSVTYYDVTVPPYRLAYAATGTVYFTSESLNKLGYRTAAGSTGALSITTPNSYPSGIVAGLDGTVYFTQANVHRIGRFKSGDFFPVEYPFTAQPYPSALQIALGPDGTYWFAEIAAAKIGRITIAGVITEISVSPSLGIRGITRGADGNLWITESLVNKIGRMTPSGTLTEFPGTSAEPGPITLGADGNVWYGASDKIGRITPAGAITEFTLPAGGEALEMTLGPDGNVWYTNPEKSSIGRVTRTGAIKEYPIDSTGGTLTGITGGGDGALWFGIGGLGKRIGRLLPSIPGDANGDGTVDVLDVFYVINFLFAGGPPPA
jgi:streptogramin lyase